MERGVKELSKYRFDCCREAFEDAKIMYEAGRYKNALTRAYYAVFHAIRAVNALQGFDSPRGFIVDQRVQMNPVWKEGPLSDFKK